MRKTVSEEERTAKKDRSERLKEMRKVLADHELHKGLTPEKFRAILEDLGPTYVKLGQIMSLHSDILPKAYCEELTKLNAAVKPMPFSDVEDVLNGTYREPWQSVFESIEETPLGSASIAQVHRAKLLSGEDVIIKVQRKGIYDVMARDIALLRRAASLIPPVANLKDMIDFPMVLDELWSTTQEEMDFLKEAANMEEFAKNNREVAFVTCPKLYREYTTGRVLVMEYIDGIAVDDKETLKKEGYDLEEIGRKLVDNFIKQVMEDGFFHADPHPGNVKIRDGQIVWIDMGMMGRLTDRDRKYLTEGVLGIATRDIGRIEEAVLALGDFWDKPDRGALYRGIRDLLDSYGDATFGQIDIAEVTQDLLEVMKKNKIGLPHGFSMLARGLTHMEGDLAEIAPDINMIEIATARMQTKMRQEFDWKEALQKGGFEFYTGTQKAAKIPGLLAEILDDYRHGNTGMNLNLSTSSRLAWLLRKLVRNLVIGIWVMALLISSSILCTTDMSPKMFGIPALGFLGYLLAFVIVLYVLIKHFIDQISGK